MVCIIQHCFPIWSTGTHRKSTFLLGIGKHCYTAKIYKLVNMHKIQYMNGQETNYSNKAGLH